MTPRELLDLDPQRTSHRLHAALSEVPEADTWDIEAEEDERVEVREYAYVDFDGRRIWQLASVWFDGKPVLIFQSAGREGVDHHERFIVDPDHYWELVKYSYTLPRSAEAPHRERAIDVDRDMGDKLTSFYGCTLKEMRERSGRER